MNLLDIDVKRHLKRSYQSFLTDESLGEKSYLTRRICNDLPVRQVCKMTTVGVKFFYKQRLSESEISQRYISGSSDLTVSKSTAQGAQEYAP